MQVCTCVCVCVCVCVFYVCVFWQDFARYKYFNYYYVLHKFKLNDRTIEYLDAYIIIYILKTKYQSSPFFSCKLAHPSFHAGHGSIFKQPTSICRTGDSLLELEEGSAKGDSTTPSSAKADVSSSDSWADMITSESLSISLSLFLWSLWSQFLGFAVCSLAVFLLLWGLHVGFLSQFFLTGFDECESGCSPTSSLSESLLFQQIDSSSVSGNKTDKITGIQWAMLLLEWL